MQFKAGFCAVMAISSICAPKGTGLGFRAHPKSYPYILIPGILFQED